MRIPLVVACVALATVLAVLQATASIALRERAAVPDWMRATPRALERVVAELEPHAFLPELLRRVLGSTALAAGDPFRAQRFAASLHAGPDRDALEGAIAQQRGDDATAVAKFLAAGDLAHLENRIDALANAGDAHGAIVLANDLLAHLAAARAQNDTIAEATYRLANVLQARAYQFALGDPQRSVWQLRSRDAYARALRLAPLEERYTIALANQSLNIGDLAAARALFARVRDLDPGSVEPLTGLADAAIRAGDRARARAYLDDARRIDPSDPAIAELGARLAH